MDNIWTLLTQWCLFLGDTGFITCPDGWVPYVDHCYKIFRETKGWQEALTSCQKEGSHLASIRSLEEHSFIVSGLGYSKCFQVYICLLVFLLVLFCLFVLFAWKKYQLPQMRYRNCINVKHCSQRHARTHKSASVSAVLSFLLQHWCLHLCSNLQTYSTVLMRFALHQCRGPGTQVRIFLSEVLWNITVNLFSMDKQLVLLSAHLGNLQCGSKSFDVLCWSPSTKISKIKSFCRSNGRNHLLKKSDGICQKEKISRASQGGFQADSCETVWASWRNLLRWLDLTSWSHHGLF